MLDFVSEQLEDDLARRQSFEQRGIALVASAGGFVTILFGLIAIASRTGNKTAAVTVPDSARSLIIYALPLLFLAAVAGIVAAVPLLYDAPDETDLDPLVADEIWQGSGLKTSQRIAEAKLKMLKTARSRTTVKGFALIVGYFAEVAAVALLALAVSKVI